VVSGSIDRVEIKDDSARIIDIKTGKSSESADGHLQLTAYQWALSKNAVTELPEGTTSAGAALLYPRIKPNDGPLFTFKFQGTLTDEQIEEFERLLVTVAHVMNSTEFQGPADATRIGREINFDGQWVRIAEVGSDE
jgi:RecB family exonuclease